MMLRRESATTDGMAPYGGTAAGVPPPLLGGNSLKQSPPATTALDRPTGYRSAKLGVYQRLEALRQDKQSQGDSLTFRLWITRATPPACASRGDDAARPAAHCAAFVNASPAALLA